MRIGAERVIGVDVRLLCASNRDLAGMVAAGEFRQDLYYRINVLRLSLPPLRGRGPCLEALIRHFLKEIGGRLDGPAPERDGGPQRQQPTAAPAPRGGLELK